MPHNQHTHLAGTTNHPRGTTTCGRASKDTSLQLTTGRQTRIQSQPRSQLKGMEVEEFVVEWSGTSNIPPSPPRQKNTTIAITRLTNTTISTPPGLSAQCCRRCCFCHSSSSCLPICELCARVSYAKYRAKTYMCDHACTEPTVSRSAAAHLLPPMMMMTFITRRGEGQGKTKKERKATKSEGRGLEEGASRALACLPHLLQDRYTSRGFPAKFEKMANPLLPTFAYWKRRYLLSSSERRRILSAKRRAVFDWSNWLSTRKWCSQRGKQHTCSLLAACCTPLL